MHSERRDGRARTQPQGMRTIVLQWSAMWLRVCSVAGLCFSLAGQTPDTMQQLEAAARQKLQAHDVAGALAAYQKLAELKPGAAEYPDEIGFLFAATGRNNEAIPYFRRATALNQRMAVAWYHLGASLMIAHQDEAGIKALQQAVQLTPDSGEYHFRLGSAYLDTGHDAKASVELAAAAKQMPQNAKIWESLGIAYQRQKRLGQARDAYRNALTLDAKNSIIRDNYAYTLVATGDPTGALREFQHALASDPGNVRIQVNVGYAYMAAGRYREAVEQLSKVIAAHPDNALARYDLGVAYKQSDDLAHAKEHLLKAITLEPSLAEAHYTLALVYTDSGEADKAVTQLRSAVEARPRYADAWFELGTLLKGQGDAGGAIDALKHSVALDGSDAGAFNTLGLLLKRKGDTEGARQAFAKAALLRQAESEKKQRALHTLGLPDGAGGATN